EETEEHRQRQQTPSVERRDQGDGDRQLEDRRYVVVGAAAVPVGIRVRTVLREIGDGRASRAGGGGRHLVGERSGVGVRVVHHQGESEGSGGADVQGEDRSQEVRVAGPV